MEAAEISRAVATARSVAGSLGLAAEDAVVLSSSNKLTLHLQPADTVARVGPGADQDGLAFEVGLARRLADAGCPVATLEPRTDPDVHRADGFVITFWTHYASDPPTTIPAPAYADALRRLHAGMRTVDLPTPHFTDRVRSAAQLLADRDRTPALGDADRALLTDTLRDVSRSIGVRGTEQLLHGEPHPGNLLVPPDGPRFIDFETACRGPVEFDLAHAPEEVSEHYPGLDHGLLRDCRILVLAMISTWRWDVDDQLPDGHRLGTEWLSQLRAARERETLAP